MTYQIGSNGSIHAEPCGHANIVKVLSGGYATIEDAIRIASQDFDKVRIVPCAKKMERAELLAREAAWASYRNMLDNPFGSAGRGEKWSAKEKAEALDAPLDDAFEVLESDYPETTAAVNPDATPKRTLAVLVQVTVTVDLDAWEIAYGTSDPKTIRNEVKYSALSALGPEGGVFAADAGIVDAKLWGVK
jgi:hypothetical protein